MSGLAFEGVCRRFGSVTVLSGIDLALAEGEFLALLGASGSGKSTLLRIAAGLDREYEGSVRIGGLAVDSLLPSRRDVAMVFQDYALYPHMSVADNIALPLRMRQLHPLQRLPGAGLLPGTRRRRRLIREEVRAVAARLGLEDVLFRRPAELSGGQRQRVALGRAVVRRPRVFLMDEPLSNLDVSLRTTLRAEIRQIQRESGACCLYVTHDQIEAMTMADRVAVLAGGTILQVASPRAVYDDPAHVRVLELVGSPPANLLPAEALADATPHRLPADCAFVGIRPERLKRQAALSPDVPLLGFRVRVRGREDHGHSYWYDGVLLPRGHRIGWIGPVGEAIPELVDLAVPVSQVWLFDADGQRLMPAASQVSSA